VSEQLEPPDEAVGSLAPARQLDRHHSAESVE
jgi:hypothetical protein